MARRGVSQGGESLEYEPVLPSLTEPTDSLLLAFVMYCARPPCTAGAHGLCLSMCHAFAHPLPRSLPPACADWAVEGVGQQGGEQSAYCSFTHLRAHFVAGVIQHIGWFVRGQPRQQSTLSSGRAHPEHAAMRTCTLHPCLCSSAAACCCPRPRRHTHAPGPAWLVPPSLKPHLPSHPPTSARPVLHRARQEFVRPHQVHRFQHHL